MTDRSDRVDDALARLRSVDDDELTSLSHSRAAQALLEEVVLVPHGNMQKERQEPRRARPGRSAHRRTRLVWAGVAAAVVIAAGVFVASGLHDTPPAAAALPSPAFAKQHTLQALAGAADAILHTVQTQQDAGRPSVTLTFESWQDNADVLVSHERDFEGGTLVFEQARRSIAGKPGLVETLEYAPRQNVFCTVRQDLSAAATTKEAQAKTDAWKSVNPGQPLPASPYKSGAPRPVDALRNPLKAADIRTVGQTVIDTRRVLVLTDSEPGMHRRYYVDPKTYLPVRVVESPSGLGKVTIDYTWLPGSEDTVLSFAAPAGAHQVPESEFPIRD